MSVDTGELLNKISKAKDIHQFISDYETEFMEMQPLDFLNDVLVLKNMSVADISKKSGQGEYVYKVFRGERKASRDVMIAIAVGMELEINQAQFLLRLSKLAALDPRDKRDSVIIYSLKEKHGIEQLNDLLFELGESTL